MYSEQGLIFGKIELLASYNEDNFELIKDVTDYVSWNPFVLTSNSNKRFGEED